MKSIFSNLNFRISSWKALLFRKLKNRKLKTNSANSSESINKKFFNNLKLYLSSSILRFVLLFIVLLFSLTVFFYVGFQINTFEIKGQFRGDFWNNRPTNELSTINTLVFSYEKDTFLITTLHILNIDFKHSTVKLYGINPLISYGSDNNIQNILSSTSLSEGKTEKLVSYIDYLLGFRIDGYISIEEGDLIKYAGELGVDKTPNFLKEEISKRSFNQKTINEYGDYLNRIIKKQVSITEYFKLFFDLKRIDKIFYSNYSKEQLYLIASSLFNFSDKIEQMSMPDIIFTYKNGNIYYTDINLIDKEISKEFGKIDIISEQAEIEVFNATDSFGLANLVKRKLQNSGATIVRVGNYSELVNGNQIFLTKGTKEEYKNTLDNIKDILREDYIIRDGNDYKQNFSGNIILILGN